MKYGGKESPHIVNRYTDIHLMKVEQHPHACNQAPQAECQQPAPQQKNTVQTAEQIASCRKINSDERKHGFEDDIQNGKEKYGFMNSLLVCLIRYQDEEQEEKDRHRSQILNGYFVHI